MATVTAPAKNGASAVAEDGFQQINLQRLEISVMHVPIVGLTPLIPHRWTEKARRMMLDKQQGKATPKKAPKDPAAEAHDSTYWLADGTPGIPATAFKAAIADAARFFDKTVTIELLKRSIFIRGEGPEHLVPVIGEAEVFEAMPRNSGGVADLRYRNRIWPWRADLKVEFIKSMLTPETVVTLVDAAGRNGVGDWRPSSPKSKTGTFGMFRVEEDES